MGQVKGNFVYHDVWLEVSMFNTNRLKSSPPNFYTSGCRTTLISLTFEWN